MTYSLDSTGTPSVTITPQAPGIAPQGPTGPQCPIGSTGASGATGPPGARRPSGPAGGIELVVCKPVLNNANNKRKPGQRCKTRLASRPIKFTTTASVRASRLRDGVVYATGAAATGVSAHSCGYGLTSGSAPRVTR
ncbi:MAG TPA: hypothetical protein VGY54_10755 [Polyangiaceae bacterium]|nr:hypothetical protein [Polyangiaceae bacterium]